MKGEKFDFSFGYPDELSDLITAQVVSFKGFTTLKIESIVVESKFNWVQKSENFQGFSRAELVQLIAQRNGFKKTVISPTDGYDYGPFFQVSETDREFLRRLGKEYGYRLWVTLEHGVQTLHWGRRKLSSRPAAEVEWRSGFGLMKKFQIEGNILGVAQAAKGVGYDPTMRTAVSGQASTVKNAKQGSLSKMSEINQQSFIDSDTGILYQPSTLEGDKPPGAAATTPVNSAASRFPPASEILPRPVLSNAEAKRNADTEFQENQEDQLKAKITLVGNAKMKVGRLIKIKGVPEMIGGDYHIDRATQILSTSGFETKLELSKDGTNQLPGPEKIGGAAKKMGKQSKVELPKLIPVGEIDKDTGELFRVHVPDSDSIFDQHPLLRGRGGQ